MGGAPVDTEDMSRNVEESGSDLVRTTTLGIQSFVGDKKAISLVIGIKVFFEL